MCDAILLVGYAFYGDAEVAVLEKFMQQKVFTEKDLIKELKLSQAKVYSICSRLANDRLLRQYVTMPLLLYLFFCFSDMVEGKSSSKRARNNNIWIMDLDKFLNSVNFRLLKMLDNLKRDINLIEGEILQCRNCNIKYFSFFFFFL